MKKFILLLTFLFIGMISFANNVSTNGVKQYSSNALTQMLNTTLSNTSINVRPEVNQSDYVMQLRNVNVRYLANSCTVTASVTVGIGGSAVSVEVSATAATCREALAMIKAML